MSLAKTLRAVSVAAAAVFAFGAQAQMPATGNNPASPEQPGSGVVSRPNDTSATGTDRAARRDRVMPAAGERNPGMTRSNTARKNRAHRNRAHRADRAHHADRVDNPMPAAGAQMPGTGGRPDQSPSNNR